MTSCRQHDEPRPYGELPAGKGGHVDPVHRHAVSGEVQRGRVGMQQHPHVPRIRQALPVAAPEVRGAAEPLERIGAEVGAGKASDHRARRAVERLLGGVLERAGLADLVGLGIEGQQVRETHRPTAPVDVVAVLEVDRIERHAAPTPGRCRTAEAAHAVAIQRTVQARVGDGAGVELLGGRLELFAAGLQQQDLEAGMLQLECHRDASRPRTDNADIRTQFTIRCSVARVVNHGRSTIRAVPRALPTDRRATRGGRHLTRTGLPGGS